MYVVTATRLRKELFRLLEEIEHGETVEITRGGRSVARLTGVGSDDWRDRVTITPKVVGDNDSAFAPLGDVWDGYV